MLATPFDVLSESNSKTSDVLRLRVQSTRTEETTLTSEIENSDNQLSDKTSANTFLDPQLQLKQLLKETIVEALHEERSFLHDLLLETLEDLALIEAISEGQDTEHVSRDDVMALLEDD